jgi:hypothetical protein
MEALPQIRIPRLVNVENWHDLAHVYLSTIDQLIADFERKTDCTAYALDFAELHLYMHRHRSVETRDYGKFDLVNYILENTKEPDVLTMLPPSVFEFLRYMMQVSTSLSRFSSYRNILDNRLIRKFYDVSSGSKLDHDYSRKVLSAYQQMDGIKPILLIATEPGFKDIIGDPLSKFVALINDSKIVPLVEILEKCDVGEFNADLVNEDVFKTLLKSFQSIRNKPTNNMVDAMVGAMVYQLNGLYLEQNKFYSNLITHSKHCLDIMREYRPSADPLNMSIVRDPVYFLARILCRNLASSNEERLQILGQIRTILKRISEAGSAEELMKTLKETEEKKDVLSAAEFFERVFVYDEDWGTILRNAYVQIHEDAYVSGLLQTALETNSKYVDILTMQPFRDIDVLSEAFQDIDEYREKLKKAETELQLQIGNLYTGLTRFLEGFNWGQLTSAQMDIFQKIRSFSVKT